MNRALWRIAWRSGARRPQRVALPLLGVALGVAAVVAVDLAQRGALRGFEIAQSSLAGHATHRISSGSAGLDEQLYARLRRDSGVRGIAPVVSGELRADQRTLRLLGVDPFAEAPFRSYFGSASRRRGASLEHWLLEPGAVVASRAAAERLGWRTGQRVTLRAGGADREILVAGTFDDAGGGTDDLLVCDLSTAQEILGRPGRLSWIDVALPEEPEASAALRRRVEAALPPDALLLSVSRAQESARQMTRAFRLNLLAMSLLALAVGGFLIYNALLFSVVSRRELFARLRCLGATRAQILLLVLGEALVLGALGTAGGLALGVVLGRGILAQVTQTLGDLYFGTQVRHVPARASSLGVGALLGLGTTLAAALAPALEAASTRPREALLRSELESRWRRRLPALVAGGTALCAAAGAALWIFERSLVVSLAAVFAGVLGFALWVPPLTALAARLCERPLGAIFGPVGRLAARGIEASLSRTGVALAALAVAVSAVVGIGVMVHSFQLSLESWLDRTLYADLLVAAARPEAGEARAGFDPDWAERIAELPGVASVSTQSFGAVESPLGLLRVAALDLPRRHFPRRLQLLQGDPEQAWPAFRERGSVILSETLAYRHALAVGDSLTLHTVRGPREFPIAGIARDYATELGAVHLHRVAYERHWSPARAFSVWLERAPGTSAEALKERVEAALPPDTPAFVTSNEQLKRSALEVFGRTFAVTRGLRGIAVAVAFAGVLSAMLALALERERELAVLRAIGLLPGQLRGLIHLQTGTMGAIAGALSLPLGVGLALALIHVVNRRSFGWTLETHLSLGELAPAPVLALGAALLAGLYPARKLGRAEPLNALREE